MDNKDVINELSRELTLYQLLPSGQPGTYLALLAALSGRINELINTNMPLLISVLYRLDISEEKLRKQLAQTNNHVSGEVIATMIIERQLQKMETKKGVVHDPFCEEERW